jgi:DNA-binding NarL/FixJ family response regulator
VVSRDLSAVRPTDDVAVIYACPSADAVACLRRMLGRRAPAVLVYARHFDEDDIVGAFDQGATSYVVVDEDARFCLPYATLRTAAGESFLSPKVATVLLRHLSRPILTPVRDLPQCGELTPREREIMELLVVGHTAAEIADHLNLTTKTVRNNLSNIYAKLQVRRQSEAILLWLGQRSAQEQAEPHQPKHAAPNLWLAGSRASTLTS